jgi:UDP-N-acetylglucosamine transferase subunit ALG13
MLVAPLNWGMGHATRLVPVLLEAHRLGFGIYVLGGVPITRFLQDTCPYVQTIDDGFAPIKWKSKRSHFFSYPLLAVSMMIRTFREHYMVKKLNRKYRFNLILSDNRYGVFANRVPSILMTHQFQLKLPCGWKWTEHFVNRLLSLRYRRFDEIWIPDSIEQNLAGQLSLSGRNRKNTRFIGPLSRYMLVDEQPFPVHFDVLVLLSGPEPNRTEWRLELEELLKQSSYSVCFAENNNKGKRSFFNGRSFQYLYNGTGEELKWLIKDTPLVIAKAGYSSIMDFAMLAKPALLVPTPGQTEQLYLASWLAKHPLFTIETSAGLTLATIQEAMNRSNQIPPSMDFGNEWKALLKRECKKHDGKSH